MTTNRPKTSTPGAAEELPRFISTLMTMLLLLTGCASQHISAAASNASAERELRGLHEQWAQAGIDGDAAFLERGS